MRPSVTLDLNTNARDLRAFNKFKTAKVRAEATRLERVDARPPGKAAYTWCGPSLGQRSHVGPRAPRQREALTPCTALHHGAAPLGQQVIQDTLLLPPADAGRRSQAVRRVRHRSHPGPSQGAVCRADLSLQGPLLRRPLPVRSFMLRCSTWSLVFSGASMRSSWSVHRVNACRAWRAADVPVCSAVSSNCILPSFICCRVPTLKEVLALVNAAQRAGKTVGVAIHTLVRCGSSILLRSTSGLGSGGSVTQGRA